MKRGIDVFYTKLEASHLKNVISDSNHDSEHPNPSAGRYCRQMTHVQSLHYGQVLARVERHNRHCWTGHRY